MVHHQGLVPVELPLPEPGGELALLGGPVRGAHTLNAPLHVDGPSVLLVVALESPQAHLLRRCLQLRDLGLLLLVLLQPLLVPPLLLLHIEGVIAGVELRLAVVDLHHSSDYLVQKPPVMGDRQHGSLEVFQVVLQPLGGVQVQMVGRLIQQEDIRILQNQASQINTGLLPTGQSGKKALTHVSVDVQTVAHLVEASPRIITAAGLEGGGQPVITGHHLWGGVFSHLGSQLLHLPLQGVKGLKGSIQHVPHRITLRINGNLRDKPQAFPRSNGDRSFVCLHLSGKNAKNGGFPCSILAQQAHSLSLIHLQGKAV